MGVPELAGSERAPLFHPGLAVTKDGGWELATGCQEHSTFHAHGRVSAGVIRVRFWEDGVHGGEKGRGCWWQMPFNTRRDLLVALEAMGSSEHLFPGVSLQNGDMWIGEGSCLLV